jgi:oligopeptide transport system ATP-binding protein
MTRSDLAMPEAALVETRNLTKTFPIAWDVLGRNRGFVHAVENVNLRIPSYSTLGIVGESGSGKSTLGKLIVRLLEPTSGEVIFEGNEISSLSGMDRRKQRQQMQMVFQDTKASLDPMLTVEKSLMEPFRVFKLQAKASDRIQELVDLIGLNASHLRRYPNQLSGGQRQRIVIARALALNPKFLVLDEPTSSLDVSIQAQILNLLKELQQRLKLTFFFITHNLSVVAFMSDRVAVMYLGKIVEEADTAELLAHPLHPYTQILLASTPVADPQSRIERSPARGDIPSPTNLPSGCSFHTRCPLAIAICKEKEPNLTELGPNHFVACHLAERGESSLGILRGAGPFSSIEKPEVS